MTISETELETVRLIFEAADTMVPVATGYTVLLVGAVTQLWMKNRERPNAYPPPPFFLSAVVIIIAAGSVGLWATAMGLGVSASTARPQHIPVFGEQTPQELISLARAYMRVAYWAFLASLWAGGGVALYFIFKSR